MPQKRAIIVKFFNRSRFVNLIITTASKINTLNNIIIETLENHTHNVPATASNIIRFFSL